mmetsp:Transcript_12283/g.18838  ORF Transcript_12283/g.18838 Transcript_12283/m.18838 type:complete len:682 (-) Transcript_12283:357-2402(-)
MAERQRSRRRLPSRRAKRKPEEVLRSARVVGKRHKGREAEEEQGDSENEESENLSYKWLDSGVETHSGKQTEYQLLEVVMNGRTTIIAVGDTVLLASDDDGSDEAFIAKVERMWQILPSEDLPIEYGMKIRARWYFKKTDVQGLRGDFAGSITKQQLLNNMTTRDLVLSDQYDDNDVLTVLGKCTVINRRPGEDIESNHLSELPSTVWISRFSVTFGDATAVVTPYDGENQPWPEDDDTSEDSNEVIEQAVDQLNHDQSVTTSAAASIDTEEEVKESDREIEIEAGARKQESSNGNIIRSRRRETIASEYQVTNYFDDADEEPFESDDMEETGTFAEDDDEGSDAHSSLDDNIRNGRGKLMIGPEHQVKVKPFQNGQKVLSRKPQLVWKKDASTDVDIDKYLERTAEIMFLYLQQNGLLNDEEYFPLPHERMEEYTKGISSPPTLSNLSTGSSMTKNAASKLTRECKIDSIIEVLHNQDYNVDRAVKKIQSNPQLYITSWTRAERNSFQMGFRRYSGSLRMISTNSFVAKSMKDVVDYYYRFKIPDQFRRYQDKKREHAFRMMQIIENRRKENSVVSSRDNGRSQNVASLCNDKSATDWSKLQVSDSLSAMDDRRALAKELLKDIQFALGTEKMAKICKAIKAYNNRSSIVSLRDCVEGMLQNHPVLLERFVEFLPKRVRS